MTIPFSPGPIGMMSLVVRLLKVFQVGVIVSNLPEIRMFLGLNILLYQFVEVIGITVLNDGDELVIRHLVIAWW